MAAAGRDGDDEPRAGVAELGERTTGAEEPVRLCAAGAELVLSWLTDGPAIGPDHEPHDELMAATVRGLLDCGERVVLSAHNGHVQRHPLFGAPSLGTLLAPELCRDMVVIGTIRASGSDADLQAAEDDRWCPRRRPRSPCPRPEPHTLDARMDALGPVHLTDLRRLPGGTLDGVTAIGIAAPGPRRRPDGVRRRRARPRDHPAARRRRRGHAGRDRSGGAPVNRVELSVGPIAAGRARAAASSGRTGPGARGDPRRRWPGSDRSRRPVVLLAQPVDALAARLSAIRSVTPFDDDERWIPHVTGAYSWTARRRRP